ncbi:zinc-dependent metalloprotease [Flavobacteriaceae bacterium]|nr:zinc-dependent metalloprotease [Flavobacteriaceae bacterium]
MLTFDGEASGSMLRSVTPTPDAVTVHQHHSFVALPDSNYKTRIFDPRSGVNAMTYYDYTTPVSTSTKKQVIYRHRLDKKDPNAAISEAVEPIIYYLDNGTPEPVRSALLEGGSWWNQAFESIGFKNAFQVKILPDDADPLDVRYNVIQWIHRSTRGWSYGSSVADPRTGEIIKGHVSLGSLRIRQDFMIALGLTNAPFAENSNKENKALELALARIRQLSAHEIGHTLGFAHNFAASAKNRTSVMDYPHPNLSVDDGKINYENAYETGIGTWDKVSVAYAYSDFPEGTDETQSLNAILENSVREGHRFISDSDARPVGSAHPKAHLWDNGSSAYEELYNLMKIREIALNQFSLEHIRVGEPYSTLEDRMVPMYLLHRYQIEAVVKLIGGLDYDYAVKGPIKYRVEVVNATDQRNALNAYSNALLPESLKIPEHLRTLLPPRSFSNPRTRENFLSQNGVTFDYLGIANSLSNALLGMLLHPERANRLVTQFGFDSNQLSLKETLDTLINNHFKVRFRDGHEQQLNDLVKANLLKQIMHLGQHPESNVIVKAIVHKSLIGLDQWLAGQSDTGFGPVYRTEIDNYFDDPEDFVPPVSKRLPDGSPIGSFSCDE